MFSIQNNLMCSVTYMYLARNNLEASVSKRKMHWIALLRCFFFFHGKTKFNLLALPKYSCIPYSLSGKTLETKAK